MTDTFGSLGAWLLEQIAEDEAATLEMIHSRFIGELKAVHRAARELIERHPEVAGAYRFRLAECEAKRRIVGECTEPMSYDEAATLESVLRLLALPYSDRSGYREEWRP